MKIPFYKYQGTGNDFVMIDHRAPFLKVDAALVQHLCDRRFGIGADGLILIENHAELDFNMIYYNADGSQSFCGNGSRCAVDFARFLGMIDQKTAFLSTDGKHTAVHSGTNKVKLAMHDVRHIETLENAYFLNTGSPHYIIYVDDVEAVKVVEEGRKIRYNDRFKAEGTNVNFIEVVGDGIKVRTYERGVEDETLSCGTGVTAAAITAALKGLVNNGKCNVRTKGGDLTIHLHQASDQHFNDLHLEGPATRVFEGTFYV